MKALPRILALVFMSIYVFNCSMAQKANYTTNDGLTIGFGLGGTYQKSDLANSMGGGFDFTLGSQLYKKENAFFSVDWKFRFLAGENRAYDHRINTDNTYSNIHYRFFSYDLELGLTLNRLRERTRILLTGFVGAGITHGITSTDLYDASDNLYDYSSIDPNRDNKLVYDDLVSLSDGNFETKLVNRAALLPTAGIFLGYQFSRSFSMGIEYKTNFYLTEDNSFVGTDLDNRIFEGSPIDRNNYVGLAFKWNLRGGSSSGYESRYSVPTQTETVASETAAAGTVPAQAVTTVPPVYAPAPLVHIFDPSGDPYITASSSHTIKATIRNVSGSGEIRFYQNGQPNNEFAYVATMKTFTADVQLREGDNTFRITAENQTSMAEDGVSITLDYSAPVVESAAVVALSSPPDIDIINYGRNSVSTFEQTAGLRAMVLNVDSKEDISLNINGVNTRDFNFNSSTKVLTTNVPLKDGRNQVNISARNESGGDNENQLFIKEIRPCLPPVIKLLTPALEQSNTNRQSYDVWAEVHNVSYSNQLGLSVNGRPVSFDFNNSLVSSSIRLVRGSNTLLLKARNECGEVNRSARISFSPSVETVAPCNPPKVSFTVTQVNREDASHELRGSVSNIRNRADISVLIDGIAQDGFSFNPQTGALNSIFKLGTGLHTVIVSVGNECGRDNLGQNINMKEPCIPPKVSFTINEVNTDEASHELRGSVSNVKNRSDISLLIDQSASDGYSFNPQSGEVKAGFNLSPGSHSIIMTVTNPCGSDNQGVMVNIKEPCSPPKVSFTVNETDREEASHELRGSVSNVQDRTGISLRVDGRNHEGFRFDPGNGNLGAEFQLTTGPHAISISAANDCGADEQVVNVNIEEPCIPPRVSFNISEVNRDDASHELRGSVSHVTNRAGISLTVNGNADNGFLFDPETGDLNAFYNLMPGSHRIEVSVNNACGSDMQDVSVLIEEPCIPPRVSFNLNEVNRDDASHELMGSVSNVKDRSGISLTLNNASDNTFQFIPETGDVNAKFKLPTGSHIFTLGVSNECGEDRQEVNIIVEEPCIPPKVSFTIAEVNRVDASHELSGSVSNLVNKADISLTVNGSTDDGFQFNPETGELNAKFKLSTGTQMIVVSVSNACGSDMQGASVIIEEKACAVRINPGNSSWQFCLVTPSGTFTRDDLTNENFSYSGSASSLYFLPIGGGGEVRVNGKPYTIQSGQYYLFSGDLDVSVSTKNQGSMGNWSVCVSADSEPLSGNGNNRPQSPCSENDNKKGKGNNN